MSLHSIYKLMLYYTTYIILTYKYLIEAKNKKDIKYNNPLTSIVVRRLAEQHVIQK